MFERFTDSARKCVTAAQEEARQLGHGYIGTEHLLIALAGDTQDLGGHILRQLDVTPEGLRGDVLRIVGRGGPDPDALASIGIDLDAVRARVEETFGPGALDPPSRCGDTSGSLPFAPESKKTLELALRYAVQLGDNFIGSEHLLLALTRVSDGGAARLLHGRGITASQVEAAVRDARRAA